MSPHPPKYLNGYSARIGDHVIDRDGWRAVLVEITEDGEAVIKFNRDAVSETVSFDDLYLGNQDDPGP